MSPNEIAAIILGAVALILGLIENAKAKWTSPTEWAIILIAVAILVLAWHPL